jgi:hypothetical protein
LPSLDGLARKWGVGSVTDSGFTRERATDVEHVVSALRVTKQKVNPRQIDDLATPAIQDSALRLTGLFSPHLADTAQFMVWNITRDCVARRRTLSTSPLRTFTRSTPTNPLKSSEGTSLTITIPKP